jgi:hypothetical protein
MLSGEPLSAPLAGVGVVKADSGVGPEFGDV